MYAQSLPVFPLVPSWLIRLGSSIETHLLSGAGYAGSPLLQTTPSSSLFFLVTSTGTL